MNIFTKLVRNKKMKYGSLSMVLIVFVIAIAVFLNLIVGMFDMKLDLTPNKYYSISDTTKEILSELDKPVHIIGLFDDGEITAGDYKDIIDILGHYEKNDFITIEYIDPDKNPGILNELNPDGLLEISKGDYIVKGDSKKKVFSYYDLFRTEFDQNTFQQIKVGSQAEQKFTGAIKFVTTEVTPTVYFLTGHDEGKIDSEYEAITTWMENNNFVVEELNLRIEESVPEDAEAVIVSSPKTDLLRDEFAKLRDYLQNEGNGFFLFDSTDTNAELKVFNELLEIFNLGVGHDKVAENDSERLFTASKFAFAPITQKNSITGDISYEYVTIAINARSVKILQNTKEWVETSSLLKTSDKADLFITGTDEKETGVFDIAASSKYSGGRGVSNIMVFGSSSFIDDTTGIDPQLAALNKNYFLTAFLSTQETGDSIYIPLKKEEVQTIQVSRASATAISVGVIVVIPLIIMGIGLIVFIRRRHL